MDNKYIAGTNLQAQHKLYEKLLENQSINKYRTFTIDQSIYIYIYIYIYIKYTK